jgi:hypothetical protein
MKPLENELEYFKKNQSKLVKEYPDKYLVIKKNEVLGSYNDEVSALAETLKEHKLGTFLIIHCTPGKDAYQQNFYNSRAVFV